MATPMTIRKPSSSPMFIMADRSVPPSTLTVTDPESSLSDLVPNKAKTFRSAPYVHYFAFILSRSDKKGRQ
jgi:hypothetical protein